jgi:hypothetical protein
MKKVILGALLFAPALTFAQATTTLPQVNASCVQNALVKKQQANQTAEATYNTAFNTAVANQITKINSATTTDLRSERDLLRNIWKQFRTDVNGVHTSPTMAGKIFNRAGARMSVMWHFAVDHDTIGPAFDEMHKQYNGPVTIAQDLTTFNVTSESVVVRQAAGNPMAWPVIGKSHVSGPPDSAPLTPPALWNEILISK